MFIHSVLFEIAPREVGKYRKDSLMWARHTKKADHDRFMRKYHNWLVSQSCAQVKVLGYYNFKVVDKL